jgi:hypothetical protein
MKFITLALALAFFLPVTAAAADFATQMLEATYKLFNNDSTATGFFVQVPPAAPESKPRVVVVTAGHVFAKMSGETAVVVLRRPGGDGSYQRRDLTIPIRAKGKPLWTAHADQDVAAMRVELPADAAVSPLPLEMLADEAALRAANLHLASSLHVLTFPTRFEANTAGFPVCRHASIAGAPLLPVKLYKTFLADFATFNGDSGGPVFLADPRRREAAELSPPLVVGIVVAQFRSDEKSDTMYEERTLHHPLGLATVLQAQFIRETIDLLPK